MSKKRSNDHKRPEWAPEGAGREFAARVRKGAEPEGEGGLSGDAKSPERQKNRKRPLLSSGDYVQGILQGDRGVLARAITLVESNAAAHQEQAQAVLAELLPHSGKSIRVGITGVPGAGKSTLIETLGLLLIEKGHRLAVLAVDPSSSKTGGSILGDKTRMENLARHSHSFIRPSPSGGALGGVTRKTRETMLVCEAAGYDVVIVETIGVGQSEIAVRSMVDFFLLVQIAGGGDELQGLKKGVIELADAVVVNKADGENKARAEAARRDLEMALHYLPPATPGWQTPVDTCSALTGEGIPEIWAGIEKFQKQTRESGVFQQRRREQSRDWLRGMVEEYLQGLFRRVPELRDKLSRYESLVMEGKTPPTTAAKDLIAAFEEIWRHSGEK